MFPMNKVLCLFLCSIALVVQTSAQIAGQMGIPVWTANGIRYKWTNVQNERFFYINANGDLVMQEGGGGDIAITDVVGLQAALDTKLATTTAASTYLTQANAISTYLSQANAASTYLTQSAAEAGYASLSHVHSIANITGLQDALDSKLASSTATSTFLTISNAASTYLTQSNAASTYALLSHTHTISNVTGLQTALDAKAPLVSPTFTGTVTIPSGASISGYLTTAAAASTYLPLAGGTVTGITTFSSATASSSLGTGAVVLSAGGLSVSGTIRSGTDVIVSGNVFSGFGNTIGFSSRSRFSSPGDGRIAVTNVSSTTTELELGGTTTSFPELATRTTNGITVQSAASGSTLNDAISSSGTVALRYGFGVPALTLTSNNTGITVTEAAGLYVAGAPASGLNTSISNAYAILAGGGTSLFKGALYVQAGNSTGSAAVGGSLSSLILDVSEPDGDVETDLHSLPIPATAFVRDGDCVYLEIDYSIGNLLDGCTLRIKVAGNTILTLSGDAPVIGGGSLWIRLMRTGSGTLKYMIVHNIRPEGAAADVSPWADTQSEMSVSFGSSIPVVITGQSGPGGIVHARSTLMNYRRAF